MLKLSELKISPAPWDTGPLVHLDDDSPAGLYVTDASGSDVAVDIDGVSLTQQEANARIIAAAPKLYDALYGLLEIVCDDCKSAYKVDGKCVKCPRVKAAEAALAKASGESEVRNA